MCPGTKRQRKASQKLDSSEFVTFAPDKYIEDDREGGSDRVDEGGSGDEQEAEHEEEGEGDGNELLRDRKETMRRNKQFLGRLEVDKEVLLSPGLFALAQLVSDSQSASICLRLPTMVLVSASTAFSQPSTMGGWPLSALRALLFLMLLKDMKF